MIIGIDGNEANVKGRVGIGAYAFELIKYFEKFKLSYPNYQFRIYLKDKPALDLPIEREGWRYRIVGPKKLWTQIALPFDLYTHYPRPDVFFTPTHYGPRFSPVPTAISVMDLSYLYFPKLFRKSDLYQLRLWTRYSVRKAKKILTISNASKNDIISKYHCLPGKVVVTYPGIKTIQNVLEARPAMNKNYILFVGTIQPRKNISRLIEAFKIVLEKTSSSKIADLKLIIVGKKGWLYDDIIRMPKKLNLSESVEFLEFVSDNKLTELYKNALCFVLPSLYEGFGLPVLEAMSNGCPVIVSNISSLPEAGGDAALYINPLDPRDIANKIVEVVTDKKLRESMRKKGYEQIKKFSWEKTAKETLKTLEDVANNRI